jgi:hypothetical protein
VSTDTEHEPGTPPAEEPEQPGEHDDEDELEEEGELEPEAVKPSDEPTREQLRELDVETERHEQRVHEIMGAFVEGFVACERCYGQGIVPPAPQPQPFESYKACPTCAGWGQVLTGSIRAGKELIDCPGCAGRGYVERLNSSGGALTPSAGAPATVPAAPNLEQPEAEQNGSGAPAEEVWGVPSWMGDPNLRPAA